MALFDSGAGINTVASGSQTLGSVGGNLGSFLGTAGKLAGALNNLSNPSQLISKLRSINLPAGGNASGQIISAGASWSGREADNDWRVDDVISFDMQEDKSIILKNKTWEQRNESLPKQIPLSLDQPLHDS